MKKLFSALLITLVPFGVSAQTAQSYYTFPTVASVKALTTRPAVVQVVDANPGIFNWGTTPCSAADDIFQITPTSGPTGCYTRAATPYAVGKSATTGGVLITSGTGVPSISTTLPNMNIGTPTAGVGTNITGVTASAVAVGGITGLGTGVATALAINVGTAGAPVILNGAGGTPSSMVGTNITGTAAGLTAGNVTTNANLTGDVTSSGNATTLATVASAGTTGSSTAIPVVTINAKGLTTGITTAAVVAPAGTLTGTTLASNVVTSSLTSLGTIASLNYTAMNVGTQAQIVGSITGSTLTVDATYQGAVAAGMYIWVPKTAHITYGTYIVSGAGATWTLNAAVASPIASTTINLTTGLAAHTGWFGGDDIYHSTKFASNRDTTATLPYSAEVTSQNVMRSNTGLYVTATVTNASPAVVTMTGGLPFASCAGCNTSFTFYDNGDTLPSPLDFVTTYYVRGSTISGNSFEISLTAGGAAINTTTAGSGTHAILTKFFSYKIAGTATALGGPLSGNLYARNDIVRGYGGAGGYIVKGYEVDVTNYGADATSLTASTYVVGLASILSNEGALTTAKGTAAFWAYAANSQWYRAYAHSGDSNSILWSSGTSVDGVDFTSATISGSPFKSTGFTVTNTGAVTGATLTSSGDILAAAASSIYWTGRSLLQSPSDGVVAFKNNGGTQGVAIDGSTSTFKVRDRANSSDANLTASTISASGNVNVATGQAYLVNSVSTLTATTLGSAVVNSSLTSVGTITTGTWNAGTVTSSGIISAAAASGYQLGGVAVITRDGDYTRFKDNATNIGLTIGNATNPSNYYSNTNHGFYSRNSAVNFATLNVTGFTVYGTLTATLASTAQTNVACYNSGTGLFTYQTAASGCAVSSARFKENITVNSNADALKVVTSLEPVKFQYKASAGMDRNWHDGFIAEQVAKVAPDLVEFEKDGKTPRAVKYQEMAPYFAGAIRELKTANDNLKAEIEQLKKRVK